jgi:ketosteroid isomerase-like protein
MAAALTPRETFERLIRGISERRWHELADLYAEDAVVDQPFAMPAPVRIEGREAIRAHFEAAGAGPLTLEAHNVVVHETADPAVIVAEYDYHARVRTTGHSFLVSNIQVLTIRDGRIARSRDYHDHRAIAAAVTGSA